MKKILLGLIGLLFAVPAVAATLPAGYTELEYIESTGTQYIDTGVVLTDEHIVDFKFMGTGNFFGTRGNAGASFGATGSTNLSVDLFESTGVISSARLSYTIDPNSIYMLHMENGNRNLKDANGTVLGRNTYESTSFTTTYTAPIFTIRWQSSTPREECGNFKLYYFKIYDANGLVRDFVPAKNSSNVVGMYDTVSGTFFTNAGTGEFIAGPEVSIRIATTAYNSARFSPVVTELNDTIATIRDVVTNTINQTKAIADLQATKQTRPDENCPAGKKCLLVEDNDGTPHWYEIIENAD